MALLALKRTSATQAQQRRLQALQEEGLRPALDLYLVDSELRRLGAGQRVYAFHVLVSNRSDAANSIREAQLVLEHRKERIDGPPSHLIAPQSEEVAAKYGDAQHPSLAIPCTVPARSSVRGLVWFEVPSALLAASRVESCTLRMIDTYGAAMDQEILYLVERSM